MLSRENTVSNLKEVMLGSFLIFHLSEISQAFIIQLSYF